MNDHDFMQAVALRNEAAAKPTVTAGLPMMAGPQGMPPQNAPSQGAQPGGPSIEDKISQFAQWLMAAQA